MKSEERVPYVLGLDIGANSVGWAALRLDGHGKPCGVLRLGARVFDAGVEGDIESGRDVSRGQKRREARQVRRHFDRLGRRLQKVFGILQRAGLLPPSPPADEGMKSRDRKACARHIILTTLHVEQLARWTARLQNANASPESVESLAHVLPYHLRTRALDERLEPFDLGRALYHLAQRRGFLSNRKSTRKKDEDGVVKKGIAEIEAEMNAAGVRTLGEFFSRLRPHDPAQKRIRGRWTARSMYEKEFDLIWQAQKQHHPALLNDILYKRLRYAMFYQRPLKSQKMLIGTCELEPGRKRAPVALLVAQQFRYLQKVNDMEVFAPGRRDGEALTGEQREELVKALENEGDLTLKKVRKLIGVPPNARLNFETGGEDKIPGNRTAAKMRAVLGERWEKFTDDEKDAAVDEWLGTQKESALKGRAIKLWALSDEAASAFAALELEDGHSFLSRRALEKLVPELEKGTRYATARKELYGGPSGGKSLDELPQVEKTLPALRNPAVARALTELRKVVNALVREHGKPDFVRIELARDLKKSRKDREEISKKNRVNEKGRRTAADRIAREAGIPAPKRSDVLKVLLADECDWTCPYTGRHFGMAELLGEHPQFDIEHIIPFDRSLDDSYMNKTLCYMEENRAVKRNKTPFEAYGSDPRRWEEMLQRVRAFNGSAARAKLERFQLESLESLEDFTTRQLNDTRYASRLAGDYLGALFGGQVDANHARRVQVSKGGVTGFLRDEYNLNTILSETPDKSRDDHRHHAVDAVAIGLADASTVAMLSEAAKRALVERRRKFGRILPPWHGFFAEVAEKVGEAVVSHRVSRKVSGALHEETLYSPPKKDEKGRVVVHIRKSVDGLTKGEIESIADPVVKERVIAKLKELGTSDTKVFSNPLNLPCIVREDGRKTPIRKVRLSKVLSPISVGAGPRKRFVRPGANHHVEIVETKDKKGRLKWEGSVVSMFEATRRLKAKEPVVKREDGEGRKFLFSLAQRDTVLMKDLGDEKELFLVTGISQYQQGPIVITLRRNCDARKDKVGKGEQDEIHAYRTPDSLRKSAGEKAIITPLGEVRRAND